MSVGWKYDQISEERSAKVAERFKDASRDELLQRITDLETQLYPLWVALKPITENSWRGTHGTSHLWPLRADDDDKAVFFNKETRQCEDVEIVEVDLMKYVDHESVTIDKGEELPDSFEVIAFHQQAPACYIGNGAVFVGDIRRLCDVLNGPYRSDAQAQTEATA